MKLGVKVNSKIYLYWKRSFHVSVQVIYNVHVAPMLDRKPKLIKLVVKMLWNKNNATVSVLLCEGLFCIFVFITPHVFSLSFLFVPVLTSCIIQ